MAAALSPFSGASSVGSPRGAWFSRTPYRNRSPRKEREETPKLQLTYFAGKTILSFNKVKVGKSKTCKLHVRNPHDFELELFLEKFPFKKGFSVADDTTNWLLQGEEQTTIKFLWTPTEAGNIRELVTFKFDGAHRLQIILLGTGVASPIKKKKRSKWNTKKSGISDLRNKCLQNRNYRPPMKTTTMSKSQAKSGSPVISQFDAENVRPAEITENKQDEIPVEMDTIPITPRSMKRSRTFELLNASLDTTPVIDVDSPSPLKATSKFEARFPLKESQAFNISLSPDRGRLCTKDFGDISISPEATSNDANDALLQSRLTFCVGKNQTPSIPTRLSSSPKDGVPFPLEDNLEIQPISHEAEFGSLKSDDVHNLPTEKDSTVATLGSIAEEQSISHILSDIKESSLMEKNSLVITPVVLEETPANLTANIETPVFPDMVSDTSLRRHSSTPLTSKGKTQQVHKEIRSSLASYNNTKTNGVNEETKKPGDSLFKKPQLPVKHRQTKPQNEPEQRRRSLTGRRRSLVSQTVTKVQPTFPTESNKYPPDVEARRLTTVIGNKTAAPSSLTGRRQSLNSQTVTKSQAPMQKKSTDESEHHEPEARRLSTATVTKDSTSRRLSTATVTKAPEQRRLSTATVTKNQDTRRLSTATVTKDPELRRLSTATVTKDPELRRLSTATVTKDPESRRLSTATVTKNTETRRLSTATVIKDQEVRPPPVTDIDQQKSENGVVCKELFPAESASVDRKRKLDDDASAVSEQDSLMLMSMNDMDITEQDNTIASVTSHDIFPIHNSIITSKPKRAKTKSGPIVNRKPTTNKGKTGTYASSKPVRGVAMARLALRKTTKRSIPSHPNLYAAQNMFYDERWTEKQERGFTKWLNHILTPDEMDCPQDPKCKNAKIDAGTICVVNHEDITLAPTKEELSLKTYTAIRRLNKLRKAACRLFESEPNIRVVKRLEEEIERGRLRVRPDKHINRDYGVRQQLLEMILSFNPLWLRIGLETIYGVVLHLRSNLDVHGLSRFVVSRLLNDPTIAAEYAHPNVIHLYRDGYEEALAKFTLKKFLLLVFFLDRAKLTKLIDLDPCLFCKDAEIKSSRGLLLQFSRDYLSGEGDVTRHLSYFGYTVSHVQTALHEFDYAVANIRVDLRSGIRVVKIMELLTGNWQLSTQLRMPAISRLQKLHNMEVALKAMKEAGIDVQTGGIDNKTIVDGHKEKTLELLWRLIFHFQINVRLNAEKVKEETAFLRKNLILQKKLAAVALLDTVQPKNEERRTSDPGLYFKSERLNLLLQWCKAVCAYYGVKIENFTVSFSDGRALCYLIHHYHPSLLPSSEIKLDTTQSHHEKEEEADDDDDETDSNQNPDGTWTKTCIPSTGKPTSYEERLTNEKHNFKCLYDAVAQLGGVPVMIKSTDMSNTIPNEKVVITYLSYLCERLLDLREETRAARIIQATWRRHKLKKAEKQAQRMREYIVKLQSVVRGYLVRRNLSRITDAVHKIQQFYRAYRQGQKPRQEFKRKKVAVVKIQSGFRGMLARKETRREKAALCLQARWKGYNKRVQYQKLRTAAINMQALVRGRQARTRCEKIRLENIAIEQERQQKMQACITIQKFYRGYQARSSFLATRNAVIKMQAVVKCAMAQRKYNKLKWATRTIQSHYRAQKVYQRENRQYNKVKGACLTIQAFWKGYQARKLAHKHRAARKIQATYRMYTASQKYKKLKTATIRLQALVKGYQKRQEYQQLKEATAVLQCRYRATMMARQQRKEFLKLKGVTILAQSLFRGHLARENFQNMKKSAIKIQSVWRGYVVQTEYHRLRKAVVTLQSLVRKQQTQRNYHKVKCATSIIQERWRATLAARKQRIEFLRLKGTTILAQSLYRGRLARKHLQKIKAAIRIQTTYRRFSAAKKYQHLRQVVVMLQSGIRMYQTRKRYNCLKESAVTLQAHWRAYLMRVKEVQSYQRMRWSMIKIQSYYRMYRAEKSYKELKEATIRLQAVVRKTLAQKRYQNLKHAVVSIQRYYRANKLCKIEQQRYQKLKMATITVQAFYRGCQARKFVKREKSARLVVSVLKMYLARKKYIGQRAAAVKIQTNVRAYQARQKFLQVKDAVLVIQQRYRASVAGKRARESFIQMKEATLLVQRIYRGQLARRRHKESIKAAVTIQTAYRAHSAYVKYQKIRKATILIQSVFRGYRARNSFLATRNAVIKIQAFIKGAMAQRKYNKLKWATRTIQSHYRAQKVYQRENRQYNKVKGACLTIQAFWKGYQARKLAHKHRAARKIQATYRMYTASQKYKKLKTATIRLQALVKGYQKRQEYQQLKEATVILQCRYRATMMARQQRKEFLKLKGVTVLAQSLLRGHLARENFQNMKKSAIKIQSVWRGYVVQTEYQRLRKAVVTLQSLVRKQQAQRRYHKVKCATSVIQEKWRATLAARQHRIEFLRLKGTAILAQCLYRGRLARKHLQKIKAAIRIQSTYRRFSAAKKYQYLRQAVVMLQSGIRMYQARQRYNCLKESAVTLQAHWRAYLMREKEVQCYQRMRWSVIKIQSYYRMYRAEKSYRELKEATIKLQAVVRKTLVQKRYQNLKHAVVSIQRYYRANKLCKIEQQRYQKLKMATVTVQAFYRGCHARKFVKREKSARLVVSVLKMYLARKKYIGQKAAAVKIQTNVRAYQARQKFLQVKKAVTVLQERYRASVAGKHARQHFIEMKEATLLVQRIYRGQLARSYVKQIKAAVTIQTAYRAHSAYVKYQKIRKATILIQSSFRGYQTRSSFLATRNAVIKMQALVKGAMALRRYNKLKWATRTIQSHYRAQKVYQRENRQYNKLKGACLTIQAFWKGYQARKLAHKHRAARKIQATYRMYTASQKYKKLKTATIRLQALVKGYQKRQEYQQLKEATAVLQCRYRATMMARQQRKEFLKLKGVTILAQSLFRGHLARQYFHKILAARKIQTYYRGYVACRNYQQMRKGAIVIQSNFRKFNATQRYQKLRHAAVVLQVHFRAYTLKQQAVDEYQNLKKSTIKIQSLWRGYIIQNEYKRLRRTAVTLQSLVRKQQAQRRYHKMKHATNIIQERWRATLAARQQRRDFLRFKGTTILAQSLYRGRLARKHLQKIKAAIRIQTTYRRFSAAKKYQHLRQAVIMLQSSIRMYQARKRYNCLKESAVTLQAHWRAYLMREKEVQSYQRMRWSVIKIQSYYRMYRAEKSYKELKEATIRLQALVRKTLVQKRYQNLKHAVVSMQRYYRANKLCKMEQQRYQKLKMATITIQAFYRGCQARKFVKQEKSARLVVSVLKMYLARKKYIGQKAAAVKIQTNVRAYQARQRFLQVKKAVTVLQERYRASVAGKHARQHFIEMKEATLLVQRIYRGQLARSYVKQIKAAVTIQTAYRAHSAYVKYQKIRKAVILIQAAVRNHLAEKQVQEERLKRFTAALYHHICAMKIQRYYRNAKAMELAKERLHSVICIQRWVRAKLERQRFKKLRRGIILLQRLVRHQQVKRHQAATKIQAATRMYLAKIDAGKRKKAIQTLQALWRGRQVRTSMKSKKLKMIRGRLQEANKNATEQMKLCNRVSTALDFLLHTRMMSHLLTSLESLEVATRLSPKCCERIAANNAVHTVYELIRSCNRSLPHMQAISFCISILLNLAKYENTVYAVYEVPDSVSTLVDLMQIYRGKGCSIFTKSCTLLVVICRDRRRSQEILQITKTVEKIRSIHLLSTRQEKLKQQRIKANLSKSLNNFLSTTLDTTISRQPQIQPEWVLHREKITEICDPIEAITAVMSTLKLKGK